MLVLVGHDAELQWCSNQNIFALQMLCYLLAQLADAFEAEATKPSTEVVVAGKVLYSSKHCGT